MMKLPSVKWALKPLCWVVASKRSRMYIRFLEDVIVGGCCVPQSFLRSGASLLAPSNTYCEKIKWSIWFQEEYSEEFYFSPSLIFHTFWSWYSAGMGNANKLCIAYLNSVAISKKMHVFEAEATVAFITKMHQVTIFLCMYLVWKQPLTIQISPYVYCFLLMANMSFCAAFIELNPTPCISKDF